MKVLIYGNHFLPVIGGVQTSIDLLARGLVELDAGEPLAYPGRIKVTVATCSAAGGMDDSVLPYRVVRQATFSQLVRLIWESDVIHVAGPCLLPLGIAWLIGRPVVVEHHGYQAICPNGVLFKQPSQTSCPGHFAQKQYKECLRCCSARTGLLDGLRSLLLMIPRRWLCKKAMANIMITNHTGMRVNLPRSCTIYYGIPEPHSMSLRDSSRPSSALEIAYVGRLVAEKGLPVLIDAAKRLKDQGTIFKLSFIGGGPEQSGLKQLVENLGLSDLVTFTGDLMGPALSHAVSKVAVVVMPSIWEETAGLSAIEQMMRGRVVIAADIGGLAEIVGAAGLKFCPGDAVELSSLLREIAEDRRQVERLGLAAHERAVKQFGLARMVKAHHLLYSRVLREAAGSEGRDRAT